MFDMEKEHSYSKIEVGMCENKSQLKGRMQFSLRDARLWKLLEEKKEEI